MNYPYHFLSNADKAAQIDADCVKACEEMGCYDIIVQPLFAGLRQEELWEANKTFYLNLAAVCSSEDTKILLTNVSISAPL
mgnify:CR=1 FL=1